MSSFTNMLGYMSKFICAIPGTISDGFHEVVEAVSPKRKRQRTLESERGNAFSEQLNRRSSQFPPDPGFAIERPNKRRRNSLFEQPASNFCAIEDIPLDNNPFHQIPDERQRWATADAAQFHHLPSDSHSDLPTYPTSSPSRLSFPPQKDRYQLPNTDLPDQYHDQRQIHSASTPRRESGIYRPRSLSRLQYPQNPFSPISSAVRTRFHTLSLHASPTSSLMGSDSIFNPSPSHASSGLAQANLTSVFNYRTPMKRPNSERKVRRLSAGTTFTRNTVHHKDRTALDYVEGAQANSAYREDVGHRTRARSSTASLNPPSVSRPKRLQNVFEGIPRRSSLPAMGYHQPVQPSSSRPPIAAHQTEKSVIPTTKNLRAVDPSLRDRERRQEQDVMRKEARSMQARLAVVERNTPVSAEPSHGLSRPEPTPHVPEKKALTIQERAGVSREEFCEIYPAELAELLEDNPNYADKIFKKHGSQMLASVQKEVRRRQRDEQIRITESELIKIRSSSSLYKSELEYRGILATSKRFAVQGILRRVDKLGESVEEPPINASHWNDVYWSTEGVSDGGDDKVASDEERRKITVQDESSVFSPLTGSAQKRLKRVLSDESNWNKNLTVINGCTITGEYLSFLKPNVWLNDEIVNAYMELLNKRLLESESMKTRDGMMNGPSGRTRRLRNVKIMNSFFYTNLYSFSKPKGRSVYDYTRVRRWTRKFDVFSYEMMLIPINQQNTHWTLGVVNFKDKSVMHLDSMGQKGSRSVLNNLMAWVQDEAKDKKKEYNEAEWKIAVMPYKIPNQNNSDDCGVFLCKFADFLCQGLRFTFSHQHINYFRSRIAHELLMGRAV